MKQYEAYGPETEEEMYRHWQEYPDELCPDMSFAAWRERFPWARLEMAVVKVLTLMREHYPASVQVRDHNSLLAVMMALDLRGWRETEHVQRMTDVARRILRETGRRLLNQEGPMREAEVVENKRRTGHSLTRTEHRVLPMFHHLPTPSTTRCVTTRNTALRPLGE